MSTYYVTIIPFCPETIEVQANSAEEARKKVERWPKAARVLDVERKEED